MKKQTIGLGILAIAVISGAAFFAAEKNKKTPAVETPIVADTVPPPEPDEQPSGKIDEHLTINNELRDVNFCGKTYKVKQILIDGVDVAQRVAELATKGLIPETFEVYPYPIDVAPRINGQQLALQICSYIQNNTTDGLVRIKSNGKYNGTEFELLNTVYVVGIINSNFIIDNSNNLIYIWRDKS